MFDTRYPPLNLKMVECNARKRHDMKHNLQQALTKS